MQSWKKKKTTSLKINNKNKTNIISHENYSFCCEFEIFNQK